MYIECSVLLYKYTCCTKWDRNVINKRNGNNLLPRTHLRITNEVCTDIETTGTSEHSFVRWQRTVHTHTHTHFMQQSHFSPPLPHQLIKSIVPAQSSQEQIQNSGVLGCDSASMDKRFPTFRGYLLPSLLEVTHPTPTVTSQKTTILSYMAVRTQKDMQEFTVKNATFAQSAYI